MEDKRPPQDESESWRSTSDKERPSFLATWLQRRHEFSGEHRDEEETEEDDDDDSESSLPKRFRRFFRSIFKRMVEPAEQGAETLPRLFPLPLAFESASDLSPETPSSTTTESEYVWNRTSSEQPVVAENTTELPVSTTPEQPQPYQRPLFERPVAPEPPVQEVVARIDRAPEQTIIEHHEIRGTSGATMALLGAEFFARRRADRKIERKLTREVNTLEEEVQKSKDAQVRLEKVATKQPEQPRAERSYTVPTPEKPRQAIERPQITQERPVFNKPDTVPDTDKFAEKHVQPRVVLEKVAEAAEHNAPLERAYERRQEVKDDVTSPVSYTGASAVGEILSQTRSTVAPQAMPTSATQASLSNQPKASKQPELYRTAMLGGMAAALAILVFAILAYLFTR